MALRIPRRVVVGMAVVTTLAATMVTTVHSAGAVSTGFTTGAGDTFRTGWDSNEPALSPAVVGGTHFGQVFNATLSGSAGAVYGQLLVENGIVIATTESNSVYGLDAATGASKWTRTLGAVWKTKCLDLGPGEGVTATPVIDPATDTVYLTNVSYAQGSKGSAVWKMHALDVATGVERAGFPVTIAGKAANDPAVVFNPDRQLQRPGLLLMNGVVYAGFGSHCDTKPSEGWVAGVATTGHLTTMWTTEPGKKGGGNGQAGVWAPGGGIVSDGSGQILLSTGNGVGPTKPTPSNAPPANLANSVVRLVVQPNGSLKATDFFSPFDSPTFQKGDRDLGSGNPLALPEQFFGTHAHPHLLVEVGKAGWVYILDRSKLGGFAEGAKGKDAVLAKIGPDGGLWGKPSVLPCGIGCGYVYETTAGQGGAAGPLRAFAYGASAAGLPTLSPVALAAGKFGFGSSSPAVSSVGTVAATGVVWVVWMPNGTGAGAELRAYAAAPVNGALKLLFSAPIGTASKFLTPTTSNGIVYIGTRDGHVIGFGPR